MRLPTRTPGDALAELRLVEALEDLDSEHGRRQVAEAERDQLGRELDEVAAQRDAAVVGCDDLSTRSLPYLDTATWPETPAPPAAVTYEQLAEESGVRPGEPLVDGTALAEQITAFAAEYGPEPESPAGDEPAVFYVATCEDCQPVLPMPFTDPEKRHEWAQEHRSTGHQVRLSRETR